MAITSAYCIGPLDAAAMPAYSFAFIGIFYNATQLHAGATVMTCVITILTLCSVISNVATASRQMFAFARNGGLTFARIWCYVRPGWDIPLNAVVLSFTVTCLLSLTNLGSSVTFNAILSIGVVALLASYVTSIGCILRKSYRNITPRTRVIIGAGIMAYAAAGLFLSDKAEQSFGFTPTEEDKKKLRDAVPTVHMVEREQ
ncbi:hypothetical protein DOTSEDRAFT_29401 [Dothistroma septosporum NZE10]|uniref:Amino acid permease/ SLC12A domain-containing protein n=1 Tax=Dothistroma septosporum (strain NZE10 / CBS 128990) TaxID=675120 RepID=N1PBI0_DOTSN|nr:hypothetical protein DOTSEDRAFT_29401 [Dothistroma septosporum NZE10]